jgi:hypothetical protein
MPLINEQSSHLLLVRATALGIAFVLTVSIPALAEDFIRGDANNDGAVSWADVQYMLNHHHRGGDPPSCGDAWDVDDNGYLNFTDWDKLIGFLVGYRFSTPPPAPFPTRGPDPTPEDEIDFSFPCEHYGSGTPLEDHLAKFSVLNAVADGGSDGRVVITLKASSSTPIAGYHCTIHDPARVISALPDRWALRDLTGTSADVGDANFVTWSDGRLTVGFLLQIYTRPGGTWIAAGQDVPLAEITLCLSPGTSAGEYPLLLESAELADAASGRAIHPHLENGLLTVKDRVWDTECVLDQAQPTLLRVIFVLEETSAVPGGVARVPFIARATVPSQGFSYSIDFDEEVIQNTATVKLWQRPDGTPYEFEKFEVNNENLTPGNAGLDEGFVVGAAILSLTDSRSVIPPRQEVPLLEFEFQVRASAEPGMSTQLRFLDGGRGSGGPVKNKLIAGGKDLTPAVADSFVLVNGIVNIVPDVTTFIRGDSNGDGTLNITDPVKTLNFLFFGGGRPQCFDAADANDDGAINMTDPIATLRFLFLSGPLLPPPNGTPGEDPTPDSVTCGILEAL